MSTAITGATVGLSTEDGATMRAGTNVALAYVFVIMTIAGVMSVVGIGITTSGG